MKSFSICIPNYNYESYLSKTIESVLNQSHNDYEIVISDNASTDSSPDIIKNFAKNDKRINYKINNVNMGFSSNLDEAARMSTKEWIIMLSSDDLINKDALSIYSNFINLIPENQSFAFSSAIDKIDNKGNYIEFLPPQQKLWFKNDIDNSLSNMMGCEIYKVKSSIMLSRCIKYFYNPFNFASTCFKNENYHNIGGYFGGRLYNPDKWFHWRLLSNTDYIYFIDLPLFKYRLHDSNQQSIEQKTNVLRYWIDEYRNSFEITSHMLKGTGISKKDVAEYFNSSIYKHIFFAIRNKNISYAKRLFNWGKACYPKQFKSNKFYNFSRILLGTIISSFIMKMYMKYFNSADMKLLYKTFNN